MYTKSTSSKAYFIKMHCELYFILYFTPCNIDFRNTLNKRFMTSM